MFLVQQNYAIALPANNVDGNVVLTVAGGNYNDSVGNSTELEAPILAVDTKCLLGN